MGTEKGSIEEVLRHYKVFAPLPTAKGYDKGPVKSGLVLFLIGWHFEWGSLTLNLLRCKRKPIDKV